MEDRIQHQYKSQINKLEEKLASTTHQLEKLSSKLLAAESQRSSFLSHILNEINNPLTSILGLTNNIKRMAFNKPELVHKQATLAFEQAFELDYKMRNVFAAATIEAGAVEVQPGKVDVSGMIDNIIQDLHFKSNRKNIIVKKSESIDKGYYFLSDPHLLQSMILNLVGNAIEFSPEDEEVNIHVEAGTLGLIFTITDSGSGISAKDKMTIFGRFTQLDEGVRKAHQGTGLGLSIVKEYAELLGGNLDVLSQPGKGSTFVLSLPVLGDNTEDLEEVSFNGEELF